MNSKFKDFSLKLKEKGYKLTKQRMTILEVIIENIGAHLTCEDIYLLVKDIYPEIGLATVYRTLLLFDNMGLVKKQDLDDGCVRYEISNDCGYHEHHHLICINCGEITEVEEDLLDSLEEEIKNKNGFRVQNHKVKFYGICSKCWG